MYPEKLYDLHTYTVACKFALHSHPLKWCGIPGGAGGV